MRSALTLGLLTFSGMAMAQLYGQPGLPNPVWTTVAEGNDCRITRAQTVIISNQGDWVRHFRLMCGIGNNVVVNVPIIANWMNEDVAIVHLGQVRSVGYRVYIETVARVGADLGVRWVTLTPPPNIHVEPLLCSPYCIIRMQRMAGMYRFIGRQMVNPYSPANNWGCTAPAWRFGPGGLTPIAGGGGHHGNPPAWRFGPGGLTPLETGGDQGRHRDRDRDRDHDRDRDRGRDRDGKGRGGG
ncbi:MAG: hypothetical protein KF857_08010 [Fimbriimonadaceae bacterium]|nr:hypothetical protein [Fimbriimonadaceae bacterium]